jgi:ribose transport system substrate-binding protein
MFRRSIGVLLVGLVAGGVIAAATAGTKANPKPLAPGSIANDWAKWNKSTCKFEIIPRSQRPKTWIAQIRPAASGTLIGFGEQSESNPFTQAVNASMKSAAAKAGAGLFSVNYDFPKTDQPAIQAAAIVSHKVNIAVSFDVIGATIPAVNKLFNDACIPVIQITSAAPNTIVFGASNELAGQIAGNFLVNYVKKQGWKPNEVTLFQPMVPSIGVAINRRVTDCAKIFAKAFPQAGAASVDMGATPVTGQAAATDWLTAHPASGQAKHVVSCTIADIWSVAVANALSSAGRDKDAAIIGQGASADGVKAIKAGGPIKASVWFDAGRYGDYIIPLALDVLAGKPVPIAVHQNLLVVDSRNASKFYR